MKPTENKENVSYSITIPNGNTRTTRTIGIDMPICNECLEHRNKYNGFLVLICSAAIVVAGIIMALFMLAEVDGFFSFLLSSGVAIGVYYLLSHLILKIMHKGSRLYIGQLLQESSAKYIL